MFGKHCMSGTAGKAVFILALAVCVLCAVFMTAGAKAETASGTWGQLTWVIDDNGCLTVSGSGDMDNLNSSGTSAWLAHKDIITSAVIGSGVTSIGQYAFYGCSNMTGITLPSGVTDIGMYAFRDCGSMTGITLPSGVTSIGGGAFSGCSALTGITLPDSVTGIGGSAFYGCISMTSVTLPSGLTSIGNYVFSDCSSLTGITIPNSVTSIGNYAFQGCSGLAGITIPSGVTGIGNYAFWNCSGLTGITISSGVTGIGDSAFQGCSSLTNITIPGSVTSIGGSAFRDCSGLTGITLSSGVTSIGASAFYGCSSLTGITLPSGVTSIGYHEFWGCSSLARVTIPDSVTSIGASAFYECESLTSIFIPSSVVSIDAYSLYSGPFYDCSSSLEIYTDAASKPSGWGEYWNHYGPGSSDVCSTHYSYFTGTWGQLTWVIDDNGCLTISGSGDMNDLNSSGTLAWLAHADRITSAVIGSGVTSIGTAAFRDCGNLECIFIPSSVLSIRLDDQVYGPFRGCSSSLDIYIETGTDLSGWERNWDRCDLRETCSVHYGIAAMGKWGQLKWIIDSSGCLTISGNGDMDDFPQGSASAWLAEKNRITSVVIENGVTGIGQGAFDRCTGLTTIYIPSGVVTIRASSADESPFRGCSSSLVIYTAAASAPSGWGSYWNYYGDAPCNTRCGITAIGKWGQLNWVIDEGCLTISGSGDMNDFSGDTLPSAWYPYRNSITSVEIGNGVTGIGDNAFISLNGISGVTIPSSVTRIGANAFKNCWSLASIYIPSSVVSISGADIFYSPFMDCASALEIYTDAASAPSGWGYYWNYYGVYPLNVHYGSPNSGTWGQLTWAIDGLGCLTVSGTGSMDSFPQNASSAWFLQKNRIRSAVIGNGVTAIGDNAFYGCGNLTNVTIPAGVTAIGDSAFYNCTGLTNITISAGVTSIGDSAFYNCTGLTNITIPAGVTAIGDSAFCGCSGLTGITIPNSVTVIGDSAFCGCSGLESFTIPAGVTVIGENVFCDCRGMESITIHSGVTAIGRNAFGNCSGLTSVFIPSSAAVIRASSANDSPFRGCSSSLEICTDAAGALSGWGQYWNYYGNDPCSTRYGVSKRGMWGQLTWAIDSSGCLIITGNGDMNDFPQDPASAWFAEKNSITGVVIGNGVTGIGDNAFYGFSGLTSITIPASVTDIGDNAFCGCSGLTSITIPAGVTDIGDNAFCGCSGLTGIAIPNSVTVIGESAFCGCSGLTGIAIPNSVTVIGDSAFCDCSGLKSVTIPDSVTVIGPDAFAGCTGLSGIRFPGSVTSIGQGAFAGCTGLTYLYIPSSIVTVSASSANDSPFRGCSSSLEIYTDAADRLSGWGGYWNYYGSAPCNTHYSVSVVDTWGQLRWMIESNGRLTITGSGDMADFPNWVTSAWQPQSGSITSVVIENGVTGIGNYAFGMFVNLTDVTIADSVTSIGADAFMWCSSLTDITLPANLTSIGASAFENCSGLTGSITIPSGVTSIGRYAFNKCGGLTGITIPSGVRSIGSNAFGNCTGLASIFIPSSVVTISAPEVYDSPFYGCSSSLEIYTDAAGNRAGWGAYWNYYDRNAPCITHYGSMHGTWGQLNWTIEDGCLTVSGSGSMDNFPRNDTSSAWLAYKAGITSVVIGNGVTNIGDNAFSGCSRIRSISIPSCVTGIGKNAFENCTGLTYAFVPSSVVTISASSANDGPFCGCPSTLEIYTNARNKPSGWGEYWNHNGTDALSVHYEAPNSGSCGPQLTWVIDDDGCLTISGSGYMDTCGWSGQSDRITKAVIGNGVTTITDGAFGGCSNMTSVEIPFSVTKIGPDAFNNCTGLTSIFIPSSVTSIGDTRLDIGPFQGCSSTLEIYTDAEYKRSGWANHWNYYSMVRACSTHFSASLGTWGQLLWTIDGSGCLIISGNGNMDSFPQDSASAWLAHKESITSVVIKDGVTGIGQYAFSGCSNLTGITISSGVKSIGNSAFSGCSSLTGVTIPSGVTGIGESTFSGCSSMTAVTIPNSLTSIGNSAFSGCSSLTGVTLPNGVASIGDSAFSGCTGLTAFTIPQSVMGIGTDAFSACPNLTLTVYKNSCAMDYCSRNSIACIIIVVHPDLAVPASAGQNGRIVMPDEAQPRVISSGAILTVPSGVTAVEEEAFAGIRAQQIVIPAGCTSIGSKAFAGCGSLKLVVIPASVTSIAADAFDGCGDIVIYCTAGSRAEAYAKTNNIMYFTPAQQ